MKKEKQEAQKRKYVPAGAMASYLRKDKQKHHMSQQSIEEQQVSISLRQKCKEPPAALVGQSQKAKGQSEKSKEHPEISVIQQQIMQQQFVNHRINIHSQQETYDLVVEEQVEKHNQLPKSSIQERKKQPSPKKNGQRIALCPAGSLSSYFKLKSRKEVQGQQSCEHQENEEHLEEVIREEQTPPNYHSFHNEHHQESMMEINEDYSYDTTIQSDDNQVPVKKKTRGPTLMKEIQLRKFEDRKPIMLNAHNQPIGPDEETLTEFRNFLGTVARNQQLAPLNHTNWSKMPSKDQIWEYVNRIYILPIASKKWVMNAIGDAWRTHKCKVKKTYFKKYATDEERMKNRPLEISELIFKELLQYWNDEDVQKIANINIENRKRQHDMHTTGPKSFASIYHNLQNSKENKEPPTKVEMYLATRKRKEGRAYQDDNSIREKIARIEELQSRGESGEMLEEVITELGQERPGRVLLMGRGVTPIDLRGKGPSKDNYKLPEECIESIKSTLEKEVEEKLEAERAIIAQMKEELEVEKEKMTKEITEMKEKMEAESATMAQQILSVLVNQIAQVNPTMNVDALGSLITGLNSLQGGSTVQNNKR
ncbi:uncharacterized protein LOC123220902 [Mangifera indica]|uniref:uncharacterized protein LOC123220902 n=1 Tax=Mangifera indica TaxID=29780 RepID=UPI001CFBBEF5|nr:uncharacterized protein LOC123220902 [Mangifera indica]